MPTVALRGAATISLLSASCPVVPQCLGFPPPTLVYAQQCPVWPRLPCYLSLSGPTEHEGGVSVWSSPRRQAGTGPCGQYQLHNIWPNAWANPMQMDGTPRSGAGREAGRGPLPHASPRWSAEPARLQGCYPHWDPWGLSRGQAPSCPQAPGRLRGKAQPTLFSFPGLFMSYQFRHVNRCGPAQGRGSHPHLFPLPPTPDPYCVYAFPVSPPTCHFMHLRLFFHLSSSGTQLRSLDWRCFPWSAGAQGPPRGEQGPERAAPL